MDDPYFNTTILKIKLKYPSKLFFFYTYNKKDKWQTQNICQIKGPIKIHVKY